MIVAKYGKAATKKENDLLLLVLESGNLVKLKLGHPIVKHLCDFLPELSHPVDLILCYTPDPVWLMQQVEAGKNFIEALHASLERPEIMIRPYHRAEELVKYEESAAVAPTPEQYAQRRAYLDECVPPGAPARAQGFQPPQEPGRWLLLIRDAQVSLTSAGIYEELKVIAEVIDLLHPMPAQIDVVDLDEHKLYQPERKTIAFYQPSRAVESRIEVKRKGGR